MKTNPFSTRLRKVTGTSPGFALVATLMLMLLLGLLALGMLSLSSISLRSSGQDSAMSEARSNARMALMLAIGELQKQMGPDQRISANGEILDDPATPANEVLHPHWTGVWDSWKAGVGESSQHQTIQGVSDTGMAPSYLANRSDYFRGWLLSLNPDEATDLASATNLNLTGVPIPTDTDTAVRLVGEGSMGQSALDEDFVSARLLPVRDPAGKTTGRYGWWIGDESQKASIIDDPYENSSTALTAAEKIFRGQAPGSMGTRVVEGLEAISATGATQLASLPSGRSLDLLDGASGNPSQNFHDITPAAFQVLADVREGGLKRDLSTLLERPIDPAEKGNEFMLYKFNVKDSWANAPTYGLPNTPQEAVPIQDLAAYYQLYDKSRKAGIEYNGGNIKLTTPDYGTTSSYTYHTDYTTLYRNPVPIKIQFIVSLYAEPYDSADESADQVTADPDGNGPEPSITFPINYFIPANAYKLRIAVNPAVTLWNPYNVPIEMRSGSNCQMLRLKPPSVYLTYTKKDSAGTNVYSQDLNIPWAIKGSSVNGGVEGRTDLFRLNFGYSTEPIKFAPGQVRTFTLPVPTDGIFPITGNTYGGTNSPFNQQDADPGWFSNSKLLLMNSSNRPNTRFLAQDYLTVTRDGLPPTYQPRTHIISEKTPANRASLALYDGEKLEFTIRGETASTGPKLARSMSPTGSAMTYAMVQRNIVFSYNHLNLRHLGLITRTGTLNPPAYPGSFIENLMKQGTPDGNASYKLESIEASSIINASTGGSNASIPLMQFSMMVGCETNDSASGSAVGIKGRKFSSRPFLHSSALQPVVIDQNNPTSPYDHGWNWWLDEIQSDLGSLIEVDADGNGFYGGGYDSGNGVTHVIQQEIPVAPPISIGSLSHARLGGFTLANEIPVGEGLNHSGQMEGYGPNMGVGGADNPNPTLGFQRVTATGQGGLYPHTLQAIGNSYAHPHLRQDKAFDLQWKRTYDEEDGPRSVTFADHSYLANKAIWDEFFFSSIMPQPAAVGIFGGSGRTAQEVAEDFLVENKELPNRRMVPYTGNFSPSDFSALNTTANHILPAGGFADQIAAYMMVEGGFNVNSTSVEAWKTLLSSLRGKPVSYVDKDGAPTVSATPADKTAVSSVALPAAEPSDSISSPNVPDNQWQGSRYLSDIEINELANAIVEQVKERGPFLSLSEFVNRRLDPNSEDMSLKGALQAAIDAESVSALNGDPVTINGNFRSDASRSLDAETTGLGFTFEAAAKGPTAYGSAAYIDQADILRHFASQLTVRGDTYVIRAYGDSLDANGNVEARAWCEAIVQRVPAHVDSADKDYLKFSELSSPENMTYGRKILIASFRWLSKNEI